MNDESQETLEKRRAVGELSQKAIDGAAFFGHEVAQSMSSVKPANGSLFTPPNIDRCLDIWGKRAGFGILISCIETAMQSYQAQQDANLAERVPELLKLLREVQAANSHLDGEVIQAALHAFGQIRVEDPQTQFALASRSPERINPLAMLLGFSLHAACTPPNEPALVIYSTQTKHDITFKTSSFVSSVFMCTNHLKVFDGIRPAEDLKTRLASYFLWEWKEQA